MPQVSTTVPDYLDDYLSTLAAELQVSKSSLVADAIAVGLPEIVQKFVLDKQKCLKIFAENAKDRDKVDFTLRDPAKPAAMVIEYAAGEAAS